MENSDLHTHTYYSDGALPPAQVVKLAKEKGIKNLAISDHNSVEGIDEAMKEAEKLGVNLIPSIEISAEGDEVLGYFIDYKNAKFKKEIKKLQEGSTFSVKENIQKAKGKFDINFEELLREYRPNVSNFNRGHLVRLLIKKGYGDFKEIWPYFQKGKEFYAEREKISVEGAIKLIKKFGGVPVLAHPWVELPAKELLKEENFAKLVKAGLKGIEIDNGDRDERRDEKTISRIKEVAKRYNLIITSGSDFHREEKNNVHNIGDYNCDEKVVEKLKELKNE